jgi:hypothetical protein
MRIVGNGSALRAAARDRVWSYTHETGTLRQSARLSGVRMCLASNCPGSIGLSAIVNVQQRELTA